MVSHGLLRAHRAADPTSRLSRADAATSKRGPIPASVTIQAIIRVVNKHQMGGYFVAL